MAAVVKGSTNATARATDRTPLLPPMPEPSSPSGEAITFVSVVAEGYKNYEAVTTLSAALPAPMAPNAGHVSTAFNLTKSLVGGGMLSLAQCYMWNGVVLNTVFLAGMLLLSYVSTKIMMKACDKTKALTYEHMMNSVFGREGVILLGILVILRNYFGLTAYLVIIRDLVSHFLTLGGVTDEWLRPLAALYTMSTVLVLALLKNMKSLKYTSLASNFIMFFFGIAVAVSFFEVWGDADHQWSDVNMWRISWDIFRALPILTYAVAAHINYFPIRAEMRDPSFKSFRVPFLGTFAFLTILYEVVGVLGYMSFLGDTKGNLVNNYGSSSLAVVMKLMILFNITCTYPMACRPLVIAVDTLLFKEGFLRILTCNMYKPSKEPATPKSAVTRMRMVTLLVFSLTLIFSLSVTEMSFLLGISGSVASASIGFIIPGIAWYKLQPQKTFGLIFTCTVCVVCGVLIAIIGLFTTLYFGGGH